MIDPSKITDFTLNHRRLEEMIIFWVLVAGKKAKTTSKLLDNMLTYLHGKYEMKELNAYWVLSQYDREYPNGLENLLKCFGFGCQKAKAKSIRQLISSSIDLKTCNASELEQIYGIGMKTSRCFIMHTRQNARHAGLDTHVLKWLRYLGYNAPKSTPSKKQYLELETIFIAIADVLEVAPAVLDLAIWNAYSEGKEYLIDDKYRKSFPKVQNDRSSSDSTSTSKRSSCSSNQSVCC